MDNAGTFVNSPAIRGLISRFQPPNSSSSSRRRPRGPSGININGNGNVPPQFPHRVSSATLLGGTGVSALHLDRSNEPTRVLLLISDTGGGHRASADALSAALHEMYSGQVETRTVDFWTEIAGRPFDKFPEGYSFLAKNPPLWRMAWQYGRFPLTRRVTEEISNACANNAFRAEIDNYRPHLIVSVHPLTQFIPLRVINALPLEQRPVFVTVCTDLGGAHPTWFHRDADLVFVPSLSVKNIAVKCGVRPEKIRLLGLPVRKPFWKSEKDQHEMRTKLGLKTDLPTALIVGGGDGVGGVGKVATALAQRIESTLGEGDTAQIVVICGKNEKLAEKLRQQNWGVPVRIEGFVNNMSDWMTASNLIISKAGPGTIAEALIRGLPIVLSGYLPGQEQPNVKYVTSNGAGEFARNPNTIAKIAVGWLANPEMLRRRSERALELARPNSTYDIVREIGSAIQLDEAKVVV